MLHSALWRIHTSIPAELFKILKDEAIKVLDSICQKIWKTQQCPQDQKRSVFIPIPKNGSPKECSNYHASVFISHASKVLLKILQARLQQFVNWKISVVQSGFRKGRGTRDQLANIHQIIEKANKFQKNIYFCFTGYIKAFNCVDHNKLWKILKETGIRPPYLPPVKPISRSRSNSQNRTWNNGLFQSWERCTSRLYIITLLI